MSYVGDFAAGAIVDFKFTTRQSTGAPFTLGGTPALSVYKDNSTTQSTTGITLTADFDSLTGLNHVRIDTTADGTFYANGSEFDVVITTGTVNSVSVVGEVVGRFTLRAQAALYPTTAGRTLDVSAGGEAGLDWSNIGSATTTVNLSGTTVKTATDVETDTADIQGRLPAALVSGRMDSITGAMAANVMTAAAAAADLTTELQSGLATAAALTTVEGKIDAILDDTGTSGVVVASGSKTGYTLTATTGLGNQTANITGNLSGSVGSVTGAVGSVTGLTASDVAAIKAKTDSLTFTKALELDVNLQSVNGVTVNGDGAGTPMGV